MAVASVLAALAAGQMQTWYQDRLQDENTADAYQRNQQAQRNSPLNTLSGIRAAGMNPALASGGSFSTPQTNALPVSQSQIPNFMEMAKIQQEQKLVDAQANLMNSQAIGNDLANADRLAEQYFLGETARQFMQDEIKSGSKYAPAYRAILANSQALSGGSAKALRYWNQFVNEKDAGEAQAIANEFVNEVYRNQKSNGAAKILATVPHRDLRRFAMDMVKMNAETANLNAGTNLTQSQIKEVAAHTYEMLTSADWQYHKDFAAMWKNEDFSTAAAALFSSAVNAAATGAGLYVGAKGLGAAGRFASGRMAPTSKKGFDAIFKTGFEGKKLEKKTSPLESLSRSEQNRRILSYY